ncbi:hypothetical protein AALP_AAs49362U000300 [Arabis alpina]|uniref:Uncharacterized protein n=1 Tax=Arabis alpina TaxID=50452 RepID=A0A087FZQ0_ARAAL|nr:hypothetical protein AALP_AAs49362U000300 [Arabis alpina]
MLKTSGINTLMRTKVPHVLGTDDPRSRDLEGLPPCTEELMGCGDDVVLMGHKDDDVPMTQASSERPNVPISLLYGFDGLSFIDPEDPELPLSCAYASSPSFSFDSRACSIESDDEETLDEVQQTKKTKKVQKKSKVYAFEQKQKPQRSKGELFDRDANQYNDQGDRIDEVGNVIEVDDIVAAHQAELDRQRAELERQHAEFEHQTRVNRRP